MTLDWPTPEIHGGGIRGSVLQVDSFGNLVTDITGEHLSHVPHGSKVRFFCQGHETGELVDHYSQRAAGTLVALVGSAGRLELSICAGNAAQVLGAAVGDPVEITW